MKLRKRVRLMLPLRLHKTGEAGSEMACTCDVSETGARLTGIQAVYRVNEIVRLERGKLRGNFRIVWIGAHGTPLEKQVGVELCSGEKSIWDVNLEELEEQYDPIINPEARGPADNREISISPGTNRAHVFIGQTHIEGQLVKFSLRNCTLYLPLESAPKDAPVQLLVAGNGFDLRLKGSVRRLAGGYLTLGLEEVRRGDRSAIEYLFRLGGA